MPTAPYAKVLVSVNGAANTSGGVEVASAATIQFSPESTVGWTRCRWEILDYPEGFTAPTGWSTAADGTIYSTSFTPASFTLSAAATRWGKYSTRLRVNEQIDDDQNLIGSLLDDTTILSMLSPKGLRDICAREGGQFCSTTTRIKGWARDVQRSLRSIEAIAAGTSVPGGSNKEFQYNNSSVMGGVAELTYEGSGRLQLSATGYFAYGAGTVTAAGSHRIPYAAGAVVWLGRKDSGAVDRNWISFTADVLNLGNAAGDITALATTFSLTATGTSSFLAFGASPAASGYLRFAAAVATILRSGTKTLLASATNEGFLFTDSAFANQTPTGRIYASTSVFIGLVSTAWLGLDATNGLQLGMAATQNVCFWSAAPTYGSGSGVAFMGNATTLMTTNPTAGVLFCIDPADNTPKYRLASGAVHPIDAPNPSTMGLRLTPSSGNPVPTSDTTNATTIYLSPFTSGSIMLYDGAAWRHRVTAEVSIALGTLTANVNYDVFAYWTGSAVALEFSAAWASDTTRTDALARQNGIQVKSGTATRRYVGTFRTTSTTQTQDTVTQRFVWNYCNRVDRDLLITEATDTWAYAVQTIRQARAQAANRVEFVIGEPQFVAAQVVGMYRADAQADLAGVVGIGLDQTTTFDSKNVAEFSVTNEYASGGQTSQGIYEKVVGTGYHAINWLEACTATANVTFRGDNGLGFGLFSHLRARIAA